MAVHEVYPGVEHRECMRHLWKNMKKHYSGSFFAQHMWAAAKSYTIEKYEYHMAKIEEKSPAARNWLDENHPYIWSRGKFIEDCKVDYINNNLSESFNSWVSKQKDQQIVDMFDTIRRMIIVKFDLRRKIGEKMRGIIISKIIKTLNARMKEIKNHEVLPCGGLTAEVTVSLVRYAVNLEDKTCSCRAWQVSGKPCSHALAFIATLPREVNIEEFVHEYFSIERFKKAYASTFKAMSSKHQWQRVTLSYKIRKPKLRRKPGRPRVARIRASDEVGTSKKRTYTECNESGHTAKYCQGGPTSSQKSRMSKDDGPSRENVMK